MKVNAIVRFLRNIVLLVTFPVWSFFAIIFILLYELYLLIDEAFEVPIKDDSSANSVPKFTLDKSDRSILIILNDKRKNKIYD